MIFDSFRKFPAVRTLCALETSEHKFYIGNVNGLFEYKNGNLIQIDLLASNVPIRVEAIAELQDGSLVIGTKGHGILLRSKQKTQNFTTTDKLCSDMIEYVHVDREDNVWVGTLNGLNKITNITGQWQISSFSTATGLPSNEVNCIASHGGKVWIGTPKGLAILDSKKNSETTLHSIPMIESIEINNKLVDKDKMQYLSHNRNNIQIQFITLAYQKFGNILYRYRFDPSVGWSTTTDKKITYIAPVGNHHFEIQSQNEDNSWSESAHWYFTVNPPWWKSWLFLLLTTGTIVLGAFSYYRRRLSQFTEQAKAAQEKVRLQQKALQAQMNPHFLFNCLNAIQNLIMAGKSEDAVNYLSRFATLVRNVLNSTTKDKITLESDLILLENYLALEKIRFGDKLHYEIIVADDIDQYDVLIPPLLIQPLVENAIIHGIAPSTNRNGLLTIHYTVVKDKLDIMITDNGVGVLQSQINKGLQNDRISFGIETSKQRIKLLAVNETTYFAITEINDAEGRPCGTKVNIQIPL